MLSNKVGAVALNTATGNQAITGLGFQPKLVVVTTNPEIADSSTPSNEMLHSFGAFDGTNMFVAYESGQYGVVTANNNKIGSNVRGLLATTPAGTPTNLYRASFVSLDADGFTINLDVAPASAYRFGYWAIGGTDITNVKVGNFVANTSNGSQSITGVGFQPDIVIAVTVRLTTVDGNSGQAYWTKGVAVASPLTQYCVSNFSRDAVVIHNTRKNQNNTYLISQIDFTGGISYGALTSMDADGFTINWVTAPTVAEYVYYIAIKTTATYKLSHVALNSITGSQPVTGLGIAPDTGMFFGTGQQSLGAGTVIGNNVLSYGFIDDTLSKWNVAHLDVSGISQSRNYHYQHVSHIFTKIGYTTVPVIDEQVNVTSLDADGFTLNVETANATASYLIYLLLGGTGVPPSTSDVFGDIV